jgi:hypothetical protein
VKEIAVEINQLFGLPAHPLVVHAAVVLLPLAAVWTVVCAAVPRLRRTGALVALGFAVAAVIAVGLAQGSGEELEEQVKETDLVEAHVEQGETVLPWAIGVVVAAAAVAATPLFLSRRPSTSPTVVTAVVVTLSVVVGVGAIWSVVDVGHSGAKATWDNVATESG